MSHTERSARSKGLDEGVWGTFVARGEGEPPEGAQIEAQTLTKPPESGTT